MSGAVVMVVVGRGRARSLALAALCFGAAFCGLATRADAYSIVDGGATNTTLGGSISLTVELTSDAQLPTLGGWTFDAYGPGDECDGPPAFTSTVEGNTDNGLVNSGAFTPTSPGTYWWVVSYMGDPSNPNIHGDCLHPMASSTVLAKPAISGQATPSSPPFSLIADEVTLSGGINPTGTITFSLYFDSKCTESVGQGSSPLASSGPTGGGFTPHDPGTYYWVASYSGDANNAPVSTVCDGPNEVTIVSGKAVPTLTATATPSITIGGSDLETAKVSDGDQPTGTVTMVVYGPDDPTCTHPLGSDTQSITAGETYGAGVTPNQAGTYHWIASYSGDANNQAVSGHCGDAGQTTVVNPATLTVQVSGSQGYGSPPSFTTSTSAPSGDTFQGTLKCSSVNGGTPIAPTLSAGGSYTIDASSCSGLSVTGPTAVNYSIVYQGSALTVTRAPHMFDVSGSQGYGSSSPSFTTSTAPPAGDAVQQATLSCSSVNPSTAISPTLPVGTYTIDGSSCSGLSLTGPTASDYAVVYIGNMFTVSPAPPAPYSVQPSGSQTYGSSSPSFATSTPPPPGDAYQGTLTCTTVNDTTAISPTLPPGTYTIWFKSCSGLSLTGPTASNYTIAYSAGSFTVKPAPTSTSLIVLPSALIIPGITPVTMTAITSPLTIGGAVQFWDIVGNPSSFTFIPLGGHVPVLAGLAAHVGTLAPGTFAVVAQFFPTNTTLYDGSYSPNVNITLL